MERIFVSVCIATYKRPELLAKLLESLFVQKIRENIEFEIIVVDNDPCTSARFVINDFVKAGRTNIKYFTQPTKNISLTRNKSVAESSGEYIMFIDDDEIAAPEWIQVMLDTVTKYNADGAFGRVLSHFDEGTPEWIIKNPLYNRKSLPTGSLALLTRSGNCIIKSELLKNIQGPFDPEYGITGGEDTHLFSKLRKKGAKFVNCYEGWISEYVPPERATLNYILKRSFIKGNNFTRRYLEFAGKRRYYRLVKSVFLSVIFGSTSLFFALFALPSRYWRLHWATKIASNVGHLTAVFGYYGNAYK
jgi:succinoglycan biosynthesis protein ExoM